MSKNMVEPRGTKNDNKILRMRIACLLDEDGNTHVRTRTPGTYTHTHNQEQTLGNM
jgi:hypothetical protein